jgi:hypothetical protein
MSDRTRLDYGRQDECWQESQEPVISFVLDSGEVFGCNFFHLVQAHYSPTEQRLLLQWPPVLVEITGPKALDFYKDFAKGKGTWIKADGVDILSVILQLPDQPPPVAPTDK